MDINLFRKIIIENELGNRLDLIYKFSDADGLSDKESGYSFGVCQFDVRRNPSAVNCLEECEFTPTEISKLYLQTIKDKSYLEEKLRKHSDVVDSWDNKQLMECLNHPLSLCYKSKIIIEGNSTIYHLADYHNQFFMSLNGKLHTYLKNLLRPIEAKDILHLKLSTLWGRKRPDDVMRRYNNIEKIVKEYYETDRGQK